MEVVQAFGSVLLKMVEYTTSDKTECYKTGRPEEQKKNRLSIQEDFVGASDVTNSFSMLVGEAKRR